jgi:hypothetical protein
VSEPSLLEFDIFFEIDKLEEKLEEKTAEAEQVALLKIY